jgi:enoyl-CoA hydratase/carnithine racemase
VKTLRWQPAEPAANQLSTWNETARDPGVLHLIFDGFECEGPIDWRLIEPWTRSRAVTVAEVESSSLGAGLDVALCSDLVYLRAGVELSLPPGQPSAGLLWALGRAGPACLARGLLDDTPIRGEEAVRLGLAQRVLERHEPLPVTERSSLIALTTARDLMRSSVASRRALELASFRLLFASGDPGEGAVAFLDRRSPSFSDPGA